MTDEERREKIDMINRMLQELIGSVDIADAYERTRRAYHLEEMRRLSGASHVERVLRGEERAEAAEAYEQERRAFHLEEMRLCSGASHVERLLQNHERIGRVVDAFESIAQSIEKIARAIARGE